MLKNSLVAFALLMTTAGASFAAPITVDEVLYDPAGVTDPLLLSGTVDMVLNGNILEITLTNTSANAAGSGAGILLTGIGFELPGLSILGGSVTIGSSTAINFIAPASGDISSEWGYDNTSLHSGAFLNDARLDYNTVVSSMESMTTNRFALGSLGAPPALGGPDFGVISALEPDAGGQEAINNTILISLNLSGSVPSNLVNQIEAGNVGLSFGSPTASVPEPASLSLLGIGLAIMGSTFRRKQKKQ